MTEGHIIINPAKYDLHVLHPPEPSTDFFDRLRKFYAGQLLNHKLSAIWSGMRKQFLMDLSACLSADNSSALAAYMESVCNSPVCYGIIAPLEEKEWNARLIDAACALGVVPVYCPSQPMPTRLDPEAIISAMESVLGCILTHPGGGQMVGVKVGNRFIPGKLLEAAYVSASIQRLGLRNAPVVFEFGSGAGVLVYLLARMSSAEFHLSDIPEISALQAYLLAVACGEKSIWFSGENRTTQRFFIHGTRLANFGFTFAVNQNSFPELTAEVQDEFLDFISRNLAMGGIVYSWNHESERGGQRRIFCAIQKFKWFHQIQRTPAWHRAGYVEEVWRKV